jgi:hypothetical protein
MEGKRRELKALGVNTVEQLASLDGTPLKQLGMGGREMKNQAQAYLDNAAGSADVTNLAAQVAALTQQLSEERHLREEYMKPPTRTGPRRHQSRRGCGYGGADSPVGGRHRNDG